MICLGEICSSRAISGTHASGNPSLNLIRFRRVTREVDGPDLYGDTF